MKSTASEPGLRQWLFPNLGSGYSQTFRAQTTTKWQKSNRFYQQNNNFARPPRVFVNFFEGATRVSRQLSNGLKLNRQPSETGPFYRQPANVQINVSCQKVSRYFKVERYNSSRSRTPKFEHELHRHKQRFGKIVTTIVLDKEKKFAMIRVVMTSELSQQRNDAITYLTCSSICRHRELFFQNRYRELFPPIAASMFVKFKRNL